MNVNINIKQIFADLFQFVGGCSKSFYCSTAASATPNSPNSLGPVKSIALTPSTSVQSLNLLINIKQGQAKGREAQREREREGSRGRTERPGSTSSFFSFDFSFIFIASIARYLSVSKTFERYLAIRNQTFLINFLQLAKGVDGRRGKGCGWGIRQRQRRQSADRQSKVGYGSSSSSSSRYNKKVRQMDAYGKYERCVCLYERLYMRTHTCEYICNSVYIKSKGGSAISTATPLASLSPIAFLDCFSAPAC